MGCCGNNQTEPEEDEELSGPLEDRSCTDVLFFLLFASFLVGMFFLFGVGVARGNPGRVLYGTDVAGDICGAANPEIKLGDVTVTGSGKDLTAKKMLYFDLTKTATILADQAGDSVDSALAAAVAGATFTGTARDYCLKDATSARLSRPTDITTIALTPDMDEETRSRVSFISKKLEAEDKFRTIRRIKRSLDQEPSTLMREAVEGEKVEELGVEGEEKPHGILLSARACGNNSAVLVVLGREGRMKVWRTSGLGTDDATKLLDLNPVSFALTGGGACRYCLEKCPAGYKEFIRRCIPEIITDQADVAGELFAGSGAKNFVEELMGDLQECAPQLVQMGLAALFFSLIITLLFRFLAGFIVYAIIGVVVVAIAGGTATLWVLWYLKSGADTTDVDKALGATGTNVTSLSGNFLAGQEKADKNEVMYFLVGAIVATVILAIVLLVLLVLRKRIKLVIALFQEAGHAVHAMPLLILVPLLTFVALAVTTALWIYGSLWIFTAGDPVEDPETKFIKYTPDTFLWWMRWYHIFGFLWITQFCIACQHLVIAGSVAGWYFAKDKDSIGLSFGLPTMLAAFYRLLRFHLGTAAFGSFIIAFIQLLRIILKYIEHNIKDWEKRGCKGPLLWAFKAFLKCAQCLLWCFEKCMKFININAYIETAIYGYNFCRAAMKAFQMLTSNALRVAAINSVGSFVLFLGKLTVVIATVGVSYEIMRLKTGGTPPVYVAHPWAPVLVAACFSYLTAHCFIAVYGMAIDTIFLSFCEDSARNDGITKPYYMSKNMMEFVENSDKAMAALEKRRAAEGGGGNEMLVREKRSDSLASVDSS